MVTDAGFAFARFAQPSLDDPDPLYHEAREQAGVFYADAFDLPNLLHRGPSRLDAGWD